MSIYGSLFIQARGVLKKELLEHLRAKRTIRRSRYATMKQSGLGQIKDAISILERSATVHDRAVPGHWEGDLSAGRRTAMWRRWSQGGRRKALPSTRPEREV